MCSSNFDIALAADTAALGTGAEWSCAERRRLMSEVVSLFHIDVDRTHLAIVAYGSDAEVVVDLKSVHSTDPVLLRDRVSAITCDGRQRNVAAGLRAVSTEVFSRTGGDRQHNANVLLLLVTADVVEDDAIKGAAALKKRGVRIIVLALSSHARHDALEAIASSHLDVVYMDHFTDPESRSQQLTRKLCRGKCSDWRFLPCVNFKSTSHFNGDKLSSYLQRLQYAPQQLSYFSIWRPH